MKKIYLLSILFLTCTLASAQFGTHGTDIDYTMGNVGIGMTPGAGTGYYKLQLEGNAVYPGALLFADFYRLGKSYYSFAGYNDGGIFSMNRIVNNSEVEYIRLCTASGQANSFITGKFDLIGSPGSPFKFVFGGDNSNVLISGNGLKLLPVAAFSGRMLYVNGDNGIGVYSKVNTGSSTNYSGIFMGGKFQIARDSLSTTPDFYVSETGLVGIGTNAPTAKLQINNNVDGGELLRFETERPWVFKQRSSGATAALSLASTISSKSFNIENNIGGYVAQFYANEVEANQYINLVPGGGKVGIGTSSAGAALHVVGNASNNIIAKLHGAGETKRFTFYTPLNTTNNYSLYVFDESNSTYQKIQLGSSGVANSLIVNGANGQTAIGTDISGNYKLAIKQTSSSSGYGLRLINGDATKTMQMWVGTGAGVIDAEGTTGLSLRTGGLDRLYVSGSNGYVGIGTTSPGGKLTVSGDIVCDQRFRLFRSGVELSNLTHDASGASLWMKDINAVQNVLISSYGDSYLNGGKLGIGTSTPTEKLEVVGNIKADNFVLSNGTILASSQWTTSTNGIDYTGGNVGIGSIADASYALTLKDPSFGMYSTYDVLKIVDPNDNKRYEITGGQGDIFTNYYNGSGIKTISLSSNTGITVYESGGSASVINLGYSGATIHGTHFQNGTVSINNAIVTEGYQLAVNGAIATTKLVVKTAGDWQWPDYVFSKDYSLRNLSELEKFIDENKHLPEVPSQQEVAENGVDVANMDAALLKKVEELTLYIIEMNKKLEAQQKEIEALKNSK